MKVNREYFNSKKHRVNYTDVYNKNYGIKAEDAAI